MSILRTVRARLIALFTGDRADAQLRDELESHLAIATDEYIRRGLSSEEAKRRALLDSGGVFGGVEAVREQRGIPWLESLAADLRYAIRALRLRPGFTVIVLITLALGIGANAAMFTIVNAVVIRPLPFPEPDRVVSASVADMEADRLVMGDRVFWEWAQSRRTVQAAAAYRGTSAVISTADGAERVRGQRATPGLFDVFAVRPLLGRVFLAGEELPGAPPVAVISEQLWRSRFGADSALVGRSVTFDQTPRTIIGVMPASFTMARGAQFWAPLNAAPQADAGPMRRTLFYTVVARLKPDADIRSASAELDGILGRRDPGRVADPKERAVVMTLHERRHGDSRTPVLLLFATVGLLLLIACANLATVALARAARRQREFAMRIALGASRWRLARFVLAENILVAAGGGVLGILLAAASVGWFVRVSPGSVANAEGISVNAAVLAFTFVLTLVTGVLFGLVPALTAGRGGLSQVLLNAQPTSTGRRQQLLRRILVIAELATAIVFLTGAGLVGKTLYRVTRIDAGFAPDQLLSADVSLPSARYASGGSAADAVFTQLLDEVRRHPMVQSAAWAGAAPFGGVMMTVQRDTVGAPTRRYDVVGIGPLYLETIGARLGAGRTFTTDDRGGAPRVAIVTETFARTLHPGGAIGATVLVPGTPTTIVGVVSDVRQRDLENQPMPLVFVPLTQSDDASQLQLLVRTTGDPEVLRPVIVAALRRIDATIPAPTFTTMERVLASETAPRRFTFALVAIFAVLAGLVAIIGLYGLLAYLVAEQTREIGIRVALGADAGRVVRRIVGQGMALAGIGMLVGVVIALGTVRALKTFVFGVSVYDVETFVATSTALVLTAFVASYIPARRASRIDPTIALRAD